MVNFLYKYKKLRVRVAGLIEDELGRILFVRQRKKKKDYWLLPGGGVEFGETAIEALEREMKEELNVSIVNPEFRLLNENIDPKGGKHLIQLIFSAKISNTEPEISKKENKIVLEYRYISIEELQELEIRPDIKSYLQSDLKNNKSVYIKSDWIQE